MMKRVSLVLLLSMFLANAYADGKYDWQACVNAKSLDCDNGCQTSSDIHCQANCKQWAKDKCEAEGVHQQ